MNRPTIVDAILYTRPRASWRLGLRAAVLAVAVHGLLVLALARTGPSLESWAADLAMRVHQDLVRLEVVEVEPTPPSQSPEPPPPPPSAVEPPPAPEPPPPATRPAQAAASEPSPPAAPGQIIGAEADGPLDLTDDVFVTGSARTYVGGATRRGGTARTQGGLGSSAAVEPPSSPTRPPARPARADVPSRARPPVPAAGDWPCPWPRQADALAIDEAAVVVRASIDRQGGVQQVDVIRDPGFGFGEAAAQCTRAMTFHPAQDERGRPRAGRTPPIRIHFTR